MLKAGAVPTPPRYVPRSFCAIPGLFGKESVEFPPVAGTEAQQFRRAAILQHQLSRAVTRLLAHRRVTGPDGPRTEPRLLVVGGGLGAGYIRWEFAHDDSRIVVNTQPPLQEIWLAARAGGFHFRHVQGRWLDTRDGGEFFEALSRQASAQAGIELIFAAPD